MFFGRKNELLALKNFYEGDQKVACIYGRQGIGKTSLVKHFISEKPHCYFSAYSTTGYQEVALFARVSGYEKELSDTFLPTEQLELVLNSIYSRAGEVDTPFVIIIDNYPAFARADAGFDSVIQDYVTERPDGVKFLLLSDSYLAVQKLFFDKKSNWKSDVFSMELGPLGFYESMEFLGEVSGSVEKAFIYGITGGIPCNLIKADADRGRSVENIFFNKDSVLLPERIIQSELRELSYYNHILLTLAQGYNRVNQISKCVDKPKDVVVPYMNTLMSIGVVKKENPVTEKTNRKKTRYSIINSFDTFWYRFFASRIELFYDNDPARLMEESIIPGLNDFMESVFIDMCREYLEKKASEGALPFSIFEIGNWWQNDDEKQTTQGFDLVAIGETEGEDTMIFGCCYYTDDPVGITTLKELIDLTKRVRGKKNVFYLVFSKSGFHENTTTVAATIKNIILVSLSEIVNG